VQIERVNVPSLEPVYFKLNKSKPNAATVFTAKRKMTLRVKIERGSLEIVCIILKTFASSKDIISSYFSSLAVTCVLAERGNLIAFSNSGIDY